jgi:hypothetical protein
LPVILYGCETWPLTLTKEHRLSMIENRALREIYGPKWDEVIEEWWSFMICTLTNYYWGDQIKNNEKCRQCSTMRERADAYRVLVGKTEGRRPLGRPSHRLEDNIKMDPQEVRWGHGLVQDRDRW